MDIDLVAFPTRTDRTQYMVRRYGAILNGRMLDVGCDKAVLRDLVPNLEYTGIDIGGTPTLTLNLEQVASLPFPGNAFDCVVCTDVLEHLDNLHAMFDELVRVTRGHLLLSLPNCWVAARAPIRRGMGSPRFYGLPTDRPTDRHKWFFNITDGLEFVMEHAKRRGLTVENLCVNEKPRSEWLRGLRRMMYPSLDRYLNRYAHTLWALLAKPPFSGNCINGRN